MALMNNLTINLYDVNEIIQFTSEEKQGLNYQKFNSKESNKLYDEKILEYDVDVLEDGCIGVILLDDKGNLLYFYYDKKYWTRHLLFELDQEYEELKHISIKFFNGFPYIFYCWKHALNQNTWSIVNYYLNDGFWKKEVISTLILRDSIKPYAIAKDFSGNMYISFITNNNLIYDLFIKTISVQTNQWSESFYLSDCIYIKFFDMDVVADRNNRVHISWIDKSQNNFCIKYTFYDMNEPNDLVTKIILTSPKIYQKQQLIIQDDCIVCYGITNDYIHYAIRILSKHTTDFWEKHNTVFSSHSVHLVKIAQVTNNPYISYMANIIVTESILKPNPIILEEIVSKHREQYKEDISKLHLKDLEIDIIPVNEGDRGHSSLKKENTPDDNVKKMKGELIKKQQELQGKDKIIHVLEGKISFLTDENKRILELNKKYLSIIDENGERIRIYKDKLLQLEKKYENKLESFESHVEKNEELMFLIESQKEELNILQDELHSFKNASFLKRLFGN